MADTQKKRLPVSEVVKRRTVQWLRTQEARHTQAIEEAAQNKNWIRAAAHERAQQLLPRAIREVRNIDTSQSGVFVALTYVNLAHEQVGITLRNGVPVCEEINMTVESAIDKYLEAADKAWKYALSRDVAGFPLGEIEE